LSGSWDTFVKEIIKGAVVKHPALYSEMTLVTQEKSRIFVMRFEFDQGKMVSLHECAKLCVIIFASRPRYARMIIKLAGYFMTAYCWRLAEVR